MTARPKNPLKLSPMARSHYMDRHWREHLFSHDEARVLAIDQLAERQHWQEILDQAEELETWATRLAGHFRGRDDGSITRLAYCYLDGWWIGVLSGTKHGRVRQLNPNPPRKGRKPKRRDPATWTDEERERFTRDAASASDGG